MEIALVARKWTWPPPKKDGGSSSFGSVSVPCSPQCSPTQEHSAAYGMIDPLCSPPLPLLPYDRFHFHLFCCFQRHQQCRDTGFTEGALRPIQAFWSQRQRGFWRPTPRRFREYKRECPVCIFFFSLFRIPESTSTYMTTFWPLVWGIGLMLENNAATATTTITLNNNDIL